MQDRAIEPRLVVEEGRLMAQRMPVRRLGERDVCAEVAEEAGGESPGEPVREIDDAQAFEDSQQVRFPLGRPHTDRRRKHHTISVAEARAVVGQSA